MLDFIILGMLMRKEMSGYDLKKIIQHDIGAFYSTSFGSIYPALERLEKRHFVTLTETKTGKRVRKMYAITGSGKEAFLDELALPIEMGSERNAHILKIYFLDFLPENQRNAVLADFIQKTKGYLFALEQAEKMIRGQKQVASSTGDHYYELSTLYYGLAISRQMVQFCEGIRERKPLESLL